MTDADLDRWLAEQRAAMADDLAALLDVEAGLREALVPARHAALVDDLRDTLDLDAGLAAIVPAAVTGRAEQEPPTPPTGTPRPSDDDPGTPPSEVARVLESLDARDRMALRNHPAVVALALTFDLDRALDLDLDHALDRARNLALADARALDRDLARALNRDLARELDRALALALDRARNDFTRADLRGVNLGKVNLEGIRWSEASTHWPVEWVDLVRRDSVEIKPGLFEIRGGTTHAPTHAHL